MKEKISKAIDEKVESSNRINNMAQALMGHPDLLKHPMMLKQAKRDYDSLSAIGGEIDKLYGTLPYKLNSLDKSNIRHPYANAKLVRKYPEEFVRELGIMKEDADRLENKPEWDTESDLLNNEYGLKLGKEYPTAPDIVLFDRILDNFGLPVPTRDKLHGYVQKKEYLNNPRF